MHTYINKHAPLMIYQRMHVIIVREACGSNIHTCTLLLQKPRKVVEYPATYLVWCVSILAGTPSVVNRGATHPCRDWTLNYTATSVDEVGSWYDWSWQSTSGRLSVHSGHTAAAALISGKFWYHSSWEVHALSTQWLRISIDDQPPHPIPLYGAISGNDNGIGHLKIAAAVYTIPLPDSQAAILRTGFVSIESSHDAGPVPFTLTGTLELACPPVQQGAGATDAPPCHKQQMLA